MPQAGLVDTQGYHGDVAAGLYLEAPMQVLYRAQIPNQGGMAVSSIRVAQPGYIKKGFKDPIQETIFLQGRVARKRHGTSGKQLELSDIQESVKCCGLF